MKNYLSKVNVDVSGAIKDVKELKGTLGDLKTQNAKAQKETIDLAKAQGESADKARGKFSKLAKFMKGLTIFAVVAKVIAKVTEVMSKNQVIADKLAVIGGTIQSVMTQVATAFADAGAAISESTNGFEASKKVIGGLITLGITPLKLGFYGIMLGVKKAQLVWEESFLGSGDPATIKRLNSEIAETKAVLNEVGSEALDAAGTIYDNASQMASEIGDVVTIASEQISKINVAATASNQDRIIQLRNETKLAMAENDKLQFQYQQAAEQQRQIRDNVQLSITDRIKANDALGVVLEKQSVLQEANALKRLESASLELSLNKDNVDLQVAKIEAEKNLADVRENIDGFRSEQLLNEQGLQLEAIDLINAKTDSESAREIQRLAFQATQETDAIKRLVLLRENLDRENEIETERLTGQIERYKEGTLARQTAEEELANFQQDISQRKTTADKAVADAKIAGQKQEVAQEKLVAATKLDMAKQTFQGIANLLGQNSKAGKAAAIAAATINTYQGVTAELATKTATPWGFALKLINIATTLATGFKAIKSITATKSPEIPGAGGGSSGSSSPRMSAPSMPAMPPSFNVVGSSETSTLSETIASQEASPVKAYVVSGDVTTNQSMERQTVEEASI